MGEHLFHITVLSNFARAFDKSSMSYSKARHVLSSFVLALLLAGCGARHGTRPDQELAEEPLTTITLLHLNDVYQLEPVDQGRRGGLARIATLRKQIMAQAPHVLFLFGGDTVSPSAETLDTQGQHMVDAWNALGLDFAVLGNHEFDLGPEVLCERMSASRFTWLGANVTYRKEPAPSCKPQPFTLRELGGVKVGILGLVLPETKETSRPGQDIDFQDACATARQLVPRMREQGAQVIVGLTHLSMREDKVLAACAPIDLILGGHEHSLLMSAASGTPILKMTADARELARVTLHVGSRSGRLRSMDWEVLPVTDEVPEDEGFQRLMHERYGRLLAELGQQVGRTAVALEAGSVDSRTRETNLGSFLADTYRKETGADTALINGGSIRADTVLQPGPITERDVRSIIPFPSSMVILEVSGALLREALEHGVGRSAEEGEPGRFPQVSGLRFTFDICQPAGSRVVDLTVGGAPLDPKKTYTLATNDFLAGGGDGYLMLKNAPRRPLPQGREAPTTRDLLRQAFSAAGGVSPSVDGRIQRCSSGCASSSPANGEEGRARAVEGGPQGTTCSPGAR